MLFSVKRFDRDDVLLFYFIFFFFFVDDTDLIRNAENVRCYDIGLLVRYQML